MSETIPKEQTAIVVSKEVEAEITKIPVLEASDDQLVIKTKAFALNPTDWKHIRGVKCINAIVGSDAAGTVVKVGKNVQGFKVGDNVSTFIHGSFKPIPYSAAFAEYVNANPATTYKYNYDLEVSDEKAIPTGKITTYEGAASLTLSIVTVGYSFYYSFGFEKGQDYSNESILIWSGATATGSIAIQIAKWLGFKNIVVTASKNRFEYLSQLGATHLYDYKDKDVVSSIRKDFGDDIVYGFDTYSEADTFNNTYATLSNTKPIIIDNLLFLNDSTITVPKKEHEVKFGSTLAYLANGEEMTFFGNLLIPAKDALVKYNKFHQDIQPFIDEQEIKHIPLTVLEGGFNGLIEGLKIMEKGSYGNEKFVARL